jgi:hypothetical protein
MSATYAAMATSSFLILPEFFKCPLQIVLMALYNFEMILNLSHTICVAGGTYKRYKCLQYDILIVDNKIL